MFLDATYFKTQVKHRVWRQLRDEQITALIKAERQASWFVAGLGARKMWLRLRSQGHDVARCTIERLMAGLGITGLTRGRRPPRTTTPDPAAVRPADLVNRHFAATRPNQLWVADFTYCPTWTGMVYVAFVFDVFSRRILGWRAAASMTTPLVLDCLEQAIWTRGKEGTRDLAGLVHHTDAGSQGGFNRSSQHLDRGGVRWARPAGWMTALTGRGRCSRRGGRRWPGGRSSASSGGDRVRGDDRGGRGCGAGVSRPVGCRWFRHAGGDEPMVLPPLSGRYLSVRRARGDRDLAGPGRGVREIARRLGRGPSTVSRELRRNAATRSGKLEYRASVAQWQAERRPGGPRPPSSSSNERLREYVQERLSGQVRRPDGTPVAGPAAPPWKGRNKPHRGTAAG